jgi:uncharacterized phage infection (PIP) family protein YhgE
MPETSDQRPTPDPTILTTEQLLREVENATKLMESQIENVDAMCKQRFEQVKEQFALVEGQRVEQKRDTQDAVDAAFSASKEAVKEQTSASDRAIAKSEASMLEQLKQLSTTFSQQIKAVTDTVGDLKERVQAIESVKQGRVESGTDRRAVIGSSTQLVAAVAAIIIVLLGIYAAGHRATAVTPTPTQTVTVPSGGTP